MTPDPAKPGPANPDAPKNQPLYIPPEERVTLDELKHRANQVSEFAVSETKRVTKDVFEENVTRIALITVGVVVVGLSLAYLMGSRAGRRAAMLPPGPEQLL